MSLVENMNVSIALTTYNGEHFIYKQLESILNQSHQPDEVLIFDDLSTDKTVEIITNFIRENSLKTWKLFVNERNTGYIINFYHAIKACNGDYIFLCDQDDIWVKNKIENMMAVFKQNPKIKVLNTAIQLIDERDNPIQIKKKKNWTNANLLHKKVSEKEIITIDLDYLIFRNISTGCSIGFVKEIQNDYIQYHSEVIPHDWLINILGAVKKGTFFYNSITTNYRIHSSNTIGVSKGRVNKIETQRQDKIKTAEKFYNRALDLQRIMKTIHYSEFNETISRYAHFLKVRLDFTRSLSAKKYLKMLAYFKTYNFVYERKILISDLIYLLRIDRFFR